MSKKCCFFGQINLGYKIRDRVFGQVYERIERLIQDGYTHFVFGGWGDFEYTARIAVISHRQKYPQIKTAYYQASAGNDEKERRIYDEIIPPIQNRLQNALVYRDQAMIAGSDYCIFYVTNKAGDTRKALDYAKNQNKPYINLADI